MDVTYEKMLEEFPESVWTRAHFARFLLERGYVSSIKEAFDRYLGDHASCYVPREKVKMCIRDRYKVVIVDDEPIIAEGLSKVVPWEKYGCRIAATAGNGQEGLEVIRKELPNMVISDISMPGMDLSLIHI